MAYVLNVRLKDNELEVLEELVSKTGMSKSDLVRHALFSVDQVDIAERLDRIEDYLARLVNQNEYTKIT